MRCKNCKYWNSIVGCIACSKLENEAKLIEKNNKKYGKNKKVPEYPERLIEYCFEEKSKYFMKNGYCKYYKFDYNLIFVLFKWLEGDNNLLE